MIIINYLYFIIGVIASHDGYYDGCSDGSYDGEQSYLILFIINDNYKLSFIIFHNRGDNNYDGCYDGSYDGCYDGC